MNINGKYNKPAQQTWHQRKELSFAIRQSLRMGYEYYAGERKYVGRTPVYKPVYKDDILTHFEKIQVGVPFVRIS